MHENWTRDESERNKVVILSGLFREMVIDVNRGCHCYNYTNMNGWGSIEKKNQDEQMQGLSRTIFFSSHSLCSFSSGYLQELGHCRLRACCDDDVLGGHDVHTPVAVSDGECVWVSEGPLAVEADDAAALEHPIDAAAEGGDGPLLELHYLFQVVGDVGGCGEDCVRSPQTHKRKLIEQDKKCIVEKDFSRLLYF